MVQVLNAQVVLQQSANTTAALHLPLVEMRIETNFNPFAVDQNL